MTHRILVVDDDPLLAMDVSMTLEDAGYEVIGPSHSVREANEAMDSVKPHAAILDFKLGRETSLPLIRRLKELDLPFLILSGHEERSMPDELHGAPRLSKPFGEVDLLLSMAAALSHGTPEG